MKFIIQINEKNRIMFDFQLELLNVIDNYNYYHIDDKIEYILVRTDINGNILINDYPSLFKNKNEYCPIGSIEFVCNYIKLFFGEEYIPKPINIPKCLQKRYFTNRFIDEITITDELKETTKNTFHLDLFVKDKNKIKSEINGIYKNGYQDVPNGDYIVSYLVNFISEWRIFVFFFFILDIRYYIGDYRELPNERLIKEMISMYSENNAPKAYTLDVGVMDNKQTAIIEIHDFFSCGLYGFVETRKLPYMFWRWWYFNFLIKNNLL